MFVSAKRKNIMHGLKNLELPLENVIHTLSLLFKGRLLARFSLFSYKAIRKNKYTLALFFFLPSVEETRP